VFSTVLRRERSAAAVERAAVFLGRGRVGGIGRGDRHGRHGSYLRFPRDLPTPGKFVVVPLRVRRFVCEEESCERMTFVEQVPGLTRRFGRRTERLRSMLVSVGLALAGRAGARMTDALKVPVSRNTLLRPIASLPTPTPASWRGMSTGSRCSSTRGSAAQDSISCANESCWRNRESRDHTKWTRAPDRTSPGSAPDATLGSGRSRSVPRVVGRASASGRRGRSVDMSVRGCDLLAAGPGASSPPGR